MKLKSVEDLKSTKINDISLYINGCKSHPHEPIL